MNEKQQEKLDEVFGSYKAEWLKNDIFKFFTEPYYFPSLKSRNPGILQGGRGTGKTTVLRGLSYQGQYALLKRDINEFDKNNFIGIYFRANTNHVRAFQGRGLSDDAWSRIFNHYINLILCWGVVSFVKWHRGCSEKDEALSASACSIILKSLYIESNCESFNDLFSTIEESLYTFQAEVNNIADVQMSKLSMASVPVETTAKIVLKLRQFTGKMFYFLIDEYENFTDLQQQCINTLIKHVPVEYTFKIGVREMGWRIKYTLNEQESLNDPADYTLTNIDEIFSTLSPGSVFEDFAKKVCNLRLSQLLRSDNSGFDIVKSLEQLTIEEESEKLKVRNSRLFLEFEEFEKKHKIKSGLSPLYKFFLAYWANVYGDTLEHIYSQYQDLPSKWNERYSNYNYSLLFKINRGRGASLRISKYYAGWKTYIKIANGNIRYLMELVHQAYSKLLENGKDITSVVDAETQTLAARSVGWKNLTELEGSCKYGRQLTQLVQSLGTIFKRLAKEGDKVAPEIVQFDIDGAVNDRLVEIFKLGVMNLALVRMPADKLSGLSSIKDYQYQLHPIFSPFFEYSFRRKRKMTFTEKEILGCIDTPGDTVKEILSKKNITSESSEKILPTQLELDFR